MIDSSAKPQSLLRLLRQARSGELRRRRGEMTLAELEDSRRALLFSRLPRMLGWDGSTPKPVQATFCFEQDLAKGAAVSPAQWIRALVTSRRLAARRSARGWR